MPGAPEDGARGPGKFERVFGLWLIAFPDWQMSVEEVISEGDTVVTRRKSVGIHNGPLFGHPPTGRRVEVDGTDVHRVADGLVAESWIADDIPRMLLELGIIPPLPIGPPPGVGPPS